MEFREVIISRKSVRDYIDKLVEEEKLTRILEAARLSPSWANKQCCNYIVVKDKAKIQELAGGFNGWLKHAPILIVVCADPKESGSHNQMDYYLVDVGIAMQQLILAATDEGLGTCWIGGFDEQKIKKVLQVPASFRVVALTPIGYGAEPSTRSKIIKTLGKTEKRKALTEIVHQEKW